MKTRSVMRVIMASLILAIAAPSIASAADATQPNTLTDAPKLGTRINLGSRTAVLTKAETLPYVESEYTRRFRFDSFENPKLKEVRERYQLAEVIAAGRNEFEQQVLLMDWTHNQFKKFGQPSASCDGALGILDAIANGHTFFCKQYAEVLVSAAASLGWVDRPLALRRHQGVNAVGGSTEHSVTEIWSNQYRKWVMLDPTSDLYVEKDGVPLNAYEIRQEWFYHGGVDLAFVVGKEQKRYRKADLPVFLKRFEGFGDLTFQPDEPDKYGFIGYIPNTDLMDAGFDYGKMFIVKDQLCDGTRWHQRTNPANPAVDPYFSIGQAAMDLRAGNGGIQVGLKTLTPNFARYEAKVDGGAWTPSGEHIEWPVHPGLNLLEARTLNRFGVVGPVSTVEVEVRE